MIISFLWVIGKSTGHFEFQMLAALLLLITAGVVIHEMREHNSWHEHLMELGTGWIEARFRDELEASGMGRGESAYWAHWIRVGFAILLIFII